jgi:hypothetical protein
MYMKYALDETLQANRELIFFYDVSSDVIYSDNIFETP